MPLSDNSTNYVFPVRLLDVSVVYPSGIAQRMRNLEPFFLQAGAPQTDTFCFSFIDSPANYSRPQYQSYECQILVSWAYRDGYHRHSQPLEVPASDEDRLKLMKELVSDLSEPFRGVVQGIPEQPEV